MNCFVDRFKAKNLLKTFGLLFLKQEDRGINAWNVLNREVMGRFESIYPRSSGVVDACEETEGKC